MMETVRISETSVNIKLTTRQYIPEGSKLHTRRRENLKSRASIWRWWVVIPLPSPWSWSNAHFELSAIAYLICTKKPSVCGGRLLRNQKTRSGSWVMHSCGHTRWPCDRNPRSAWWLVGTVDCMPSLRRLLLQITPRHLVIKIWDSLTLGPFLMVQNLEMKFHVLTATTMKIIYSLLLYGAM
jgi:hypothetical protein